MTVRVVDGGFLTTVQDLGRWGFQKDGISVSGVMDAFASRIANFLVGNEGNEATLEITMVGPTLHFAIETIIAICGGDFSCTLNEKPVSLWRPIHVHAGDALKIGACRQGYRGYIAVAGGWQVPLVMNSRSTDRKAAIGGYNGRPLEKGDELFLPAVVDLPSLNWGIPYWAQSYIKGKEKTVRVVEGPEYLMFTPESREQFFSSMYEVTTSSDRMGYRLYGQKLETCNAREMVSEAVTFGTIQVPPSGQPIVLMADRQTTGGYPRIAQVIAADLPTLAQARPGQYIQFQRTTWQEAERLYVQHEHDMRRWKMMIRNKWREARGAD